MRLTRRSRLGALCATVGVAGGLLAMAAPAGATTVDRGSTKLLSCENVSSRLAVRDGTKHGLDNTVRDVKASGIKHEEGFAAGDPKLAKYEPDGANTPDLGDTDSCSGQLANSGTSPYAGHFAPYTPIQNMTGSFNEIVKMAGSLTGRVTCDSALVDPSEYTLHGKLVIAFGSEPAVGSVATPTKLDNLGKPVQSQVYVNATSDPAFVDRVVLSGIGIKGVGEGAWFDAAVAYRPAGPNGIGYALESCFGGGDTNGDGIIGEPPVGGLVNIVTDTDVDTNTLGGPTTDPAYNNSMDWSI